MLHQGFVYALDIAQLMGDKMPACKDGDYEQWTVPADDRTPRCLLGEGDAVTVPVWCCYEFSPYSSQHPKSLTL